MLDKKVTIAKVGGDFCPIPMGVYTCQITDVNLKQAPKFHSTEMEDILLYEFTILNDGVLEDGSQLKGRKVWRRTRLSIGTKSWLYKIAKAVKGRELLESEIDSFDPESLVGKQVDCMVEQAPSKDGTQIFNNIIAFSTTKKPLEAVVTDKGVATETTTTKSVAVASPSEDEDVDAEIAALEAQAKVAAAKAAAAKKNK